MYIYMHRIMYLNYGLHLYNQTLDFHEIIDYDRTIGCEVIAIISHATHFKAIFYLQIMTKYAWLYM